MENVENINEDQPKSSHKKKKTLLLILLLLLLVLIGIAIALPLLLIKDEVKISDLKLEQNVFKYNENYLNAKVYVFYDDDSEKEITLNDTYISQEDKEKFNIVGENHQITLTYENFSKAFYITIAEAEFSPSEIDNLVYYQNDEDNESIHCLDLSSNQDTKINDEVSYCLMVDQKEKRIFYTNLDNELISISLEGKDKQVLGENTSLYTYDGVYLYYLTDQGVMRCNLDGDEKLIYESANLELINMIGDKLIVQEDNTLYQMDRDGKNVEEIYTSITDMTFEVIGKQLLVLSTEDYNQFSYQIVNLDGTSKSLTENQSGLIGNEV